MRTKKLKKLLATAIVISTSTTILPVSTIAMAADIATTSTNNSISDIDSVSLETPVESAGITSTTSSAVYYNDFENDELPDKVNWNTNLSSVAIEDINGNKALGFNASFDPAGTWSNETSVCFFTNSTEIIKANSVIKFDILIPKASANNFTGEIKFGGLLQGNWSDKGQGYGSVSLNDFEDDGDYLRKPVSVKTDIDTEELSDLVIKIAGYQCNYAGKIYLDNIKLVAARAQDGTTPLPTVSDMEWNFDTDAQGWGYGGNWTYNGPTDNVVNYDSSAIGSGALKLSVDYSNNSSDSWSEFKINKDLGTTTSFNGYNILTYDFIYDPSKMAAGGFQTKLFVTDSLNTYGAIDLTNEVDIGGGLKKAHVTLKFTSKDVSANSIILGIIGSNTDYKGDIYIDNIKLSQEQVADKYVEKTSTTTQQNKIDVSNLMPSQVKLVDSSATSQVADLYAYLKGVGKSNYVLYGHQNDTHHKAFLQDSGTDSDTKDVTGSIAAICGIDALSLTGSELSLTAAEKANGEDLISKAAKLSIDTSNEGGIVTLSAHMPNFELVKEKGKDANGHYDYSGYTPGTTTGNIVSRIMPGGDLNDAYDGYLDMISDYAHQLEAAGVPVLFRPFHENNGSWFWWGKAYCDAAAYKNMYRYTVQYLKDTKNVHNFLYVYSPNGPFEDETDYLSRYPGDEFIDILAFDYYDDNPTADAATDPWMKSFKDTIGLVQGIANSREKLSAVSEVGTRVGNGGLAVSGNLDKDWFSHVSNIVKDSDMPYYMVWANFDETNFFAPYMVSDTKGHEIINQFINYYNEEESVFADGVEDYASAATGIDSEYSYGFITGPTSGGRILSPITITASVKGYNGQVKFVLKNKNGESVETLNSVSNNGEYSADITQSILDKIGQTVGTIELYSDDTKLDTIKEIFNIKEAIKDPKAVDDFESYSGEDAILQNAWATNYGAGCSVTPKLDITNKNSGDYGLAFNYKIEPNGWAGITQALNANWSGCDALQIWVKPDGKGQKLVIQLVSNGKRFEVWMNDFAATTEAKLLTIPFSEFKNIDNGTFDLAYIDKMGIWCNTIGSDTVNSVLYFDDIKAINTKTPEIAMPSTVVINGTQKAGSILTAELLKADSTEFIPSENVTYAWYRLSNKDDSIANGTLVGADKTYKLIGSDKGYYIKLVVTYNDKAFESISSFIARNSSSSSSGSSSSSSLGSSSSNNVLAPTATTTSVSVVTNADGIVKLVDNNGKALTGWQQVNDAWYLADTIGVAQKGWQQVNGTWYLLAQNGAMQTGWQQVNGKWYLLASSGEMQTGWQKVDDKWYYLYSDGSMASDTFIDGYRVDTSGAWVK
ncbi:mannanase [Clostridium chromiireducens]|uniref:Mannanase n=1 Tax=Clostridium chromiireducens TaxID=225345 RepID=A0A399ITX1_9CLOT|nr:glycosyl hydrolase [Clostridium chromiireducens]RII36464.1 mannanase [Clostridium chromiireducens]